MGLAELSSTFFIKTAHYIKKIIVPSRHELYHGAVSSNLLTIKGIQMNQMTQNRFGGVPTAHNGNTKTRFFRKPIAALLMLLVFLGAGGKAWGQVTYHHTIHWTGSQEGSGGTPELLWDGQIAFFDGVSNHNGGWCNVKILLDGDITLKKPILVWQGQTICFEANNGNRTIFRSIDVNKSMFYAGGSANGVSDSRGTLIMDGGAYTITIDGEGNDTNAHVIHVQTTSTYNNSINKVTFQNFKSYQDGPVIQVNGGGKLTCSNCTFINNIAKYHQPFSGSNGRGGAVNNLGFFYCTTNCTFQDNSSPGWAGAIYNSGVMELTGCTFSGNTAAVGGAIDIAHSGNFASKLDRCVFYANIATSTNTNVTSTGGAINVENANGSITCTKVTFGDGTLAKANQARDYGGAVYNDDGTVTFNGCDFNYNLTTGSYGGGAIGNTGSITCQNYTSGGITTSCTFTGNKAHKGAGIWNDGTATCTNCRFENNETSTTVDGNFGGGINNEQYATLSCTGCTFYNNKAYVGGGICSFGKVTATSCTFNSNRGEENGGGLYQSNDDSDPSVVTSCHFYNNKARQGGGIFSSGYLKITEDSNTTLRTTEIHDNQCITSSSGYNGGGIFTNGVVDMEAGKIYSNNTNINHGAGVFVAVILVPGTTTYTVGDFRLKGSSAIYSNIASSNGGGVYVEELNGNKASFTMSGTSNIGTSGGNSAANGGGIYSKGTVTINAGTIVNNTASGNGGGAYVADGTFSLSGGNIGASSSANKANKGGGVYVAGGTFNLSGGNVQYNTVAGSDKFGAGIYLSSGTVSMTGGTVNNNTGATSGGGVYMAGGTFNLSDGYISYNSTSGYGGGVRLEGGTLAMSGGQIVNNTSSSYGGGVYKTDGTLRLTGAPVIKDNLRGSSANDVFLNNATTDKYVLIGAAGLECGAEIGVFKATAGDYKIAEAEGSNATANANYAMRNRLFFDDRGSNIGSSTSSPYYNVQSSILYLVNGTAPAWSQTTQPSGYSVSGGTTITISSAQGLAYMAHQVNSGADTYSGKTVQLSADIDLSGNKWVPIGYMTECDRDPSAPEGFKGTFDGKGHTIYNMDCDHPFYDNAGLFGIVRGGTVKNLMVSGTITNASANLGGIVGEMIGGSVYNCMSSVTPTGGTNRGALVGKITNSGSLYNSFANSSSPLVGNNAGTVANCYVRGASILVTTGTNYCYASSGSASGTNGTFSAVETTRPYSYNCFDNQVTATNTYVPTTTTANPDKQLVTTLNNWVAAQTTPNDYAGWVRPTTPRINGDYPVLKMPGSDAVASNGDGNVLHYGAVSGTGNLLRTYTSASYAICLYNSVSTVESNSSRSAEFYINEDVAIGSGSGVNAHVGITLKDGAWHMFSPAIANAPLGITYTDNTTDYGYNATLPEVSFNNDDGYFPKTNISGGDYYDSWDYYCYYEPQYHWINFKRNGNSHHHEDGNHEHINYKATPSASVNVNETTLIPAKGYLLGTKLQTFLQAEGTLNDGQVNIALTSQSPLRTGYNFIGNPYQAYLDFDAFAKYTSNLGIWEGSSVTNASYVILESSGYMSYVHGASENDLGADRYLHPHQGFMVVVKNGATSATFTNNMRSTTNTAAFRGDQVNYPLVNLIATEADGKRDITTVELGRPDQGGALKQYDLHYGKGAIYTHYEDNDYAIAFTQPGISEVGIRFETDEDATYTLSWDTENGEFSYLHLIDNITGIDTDCLTTSEYRFAAKTSDYKSRFKLAFGYTGVEENEDGASTGSATFAFLMGNELVVNCGPSTSSGTATLQMFDLMGRMMMERQVSGTQTSIMMPDMPAGVYVLRLSGNNGTRTQKIVME